MSLPGDTPARTRLERIVRVDHAGEYGAQRIYQGQLAVLGAGDKGDILRHMQAQEQVHLDTFTKLIAERRVRPTALLPLWHLAGYALGAVTAAMGERAAMACQWRWRRRSTSTTARRWRTLAKRSPSCARR